MPSASKSTARDIARVVTQWTPGIRPTWTISDVRNALRQHAVGDFSLSAQLVDSMGEDDELPGALDKRTDAVLATPFELEPVEAPNRQLSKRLADMFGPIWPNMFNSGELADFLRWYIMLGVALAVLDWEPGTSIWTAKLRVLHPQFLRWDAERRVFVYYAQQGQLDVDPGNGTWVLLTDGNRGWMRGVVRSLAIDWIAKQLTIRDWNRYNERHGLPIIKAYAPAIAEESDTLAFWEDLQNLQSETVAQLPTDLDDNGAQFDLELLEAKDGSWQSFKDQLERIDRKFQIRILGNNLSSEIVSGGSKAAAQVHSDVEGVKSASDSRRLSVVLREQALWPICAANVASVRLEVVPCPEWDVEPPDDLVNDAEALKGLGMALKAIAEGGYRVSNIEDIADKYGLELEEAPVPVAPVATPATAPADGSIDVNFDDQQSPVAAE